MPETPLPAVPPPRSAWAVVALAAALVSAPWAGHVDDTDAQVYQTVSRRLVQDGQWLNLRYLPGVQPGFREHLPFGFWPFALAIRAVGEGALPVLAALFTLGALALVGAVGRRLGGPWAGEISMGVLVLNESFILYGGRPRLDPLLIFLTVAAVAPLLFPKVRASRWLLATALSALAALVKGPFGLVPLACVAAARAIAHRSFKPLVIGTVASIAAAVPVAAFLLWDRARGGGTYWDGYLKQQLWASAMGGRSDGSAHFWFPLATLAGRFWPGLPLSLAGATFAWRRPSVGRPEAVGPSRSEADDDTARQGARLLSVFCGLMILTLCLPTRKVWNHALIAYPGLALLAGVGCASWVRARLSRTNARRWELALWALAGFGGIASIAGAGRWLLPRPCVVSSELAPALAALPPGSAVGVVSNPTRWPVVAELSAERDLSVWLADSFSEAGGRIPPTASELLVPEDQWPGSELQPWRAIARARGWVLLGRSGFSGTYPRAR